jgi:hypothetical protein
VRLRISSYVQLRTSTTYTQRPRIQRELQAVAQKERYSVYLLYWYKSTNTDAEGKPQRPRTARAASSVAYCKRSSCDYCLTASTYPASAYSCVCLCQRGPLSRGVRARAASSSCDYISSVLIQLYMSVTERTTFERGASAISEARSKRCWIRLARKSAAWPTSATRSAQRFCSGQYLYFCTSKASGMADLRDALHAQRFCWGTQVTCFTSTKVQMLTPEGCVPGSKQHTADGVEDKRQQRLGLLALLVQKYKY